MAQPTRVKICGVGRVEDALAAARAGADAIGLVLHRASARYVDAGRARAIIDALPPFVTPVGLFVGAPAYEVKQTAAALGLRHVQLHGDEDADCVGQLRDLVVIKAIRVARESFRPELNAWRAAIAAKKLSNLRGIVLETAASLPGGTGLANDWAFLRECQEQGMFEDMPAIIAAGGLAPETVGAVIGDLHPWAVDVSSGVEIAKGIKSVERILAFVEAVRAAK
ncbi:MAG TPA: phosphoribosylanthranilate isomerase [Tepidisphaeraceae bacterium]|jgi:phosphoribosylanthranilate isomerase|nr:phosphoribosylanthranilate isomerase [Tepidisphaeraceae bacterium]